jgi:GT2 family glycosyltransferase
MNHHESGCNKVPRPEKVSILMLTHNAPRYVELSIRTVNELTRDVKYELVVVDNASGGPTRTLLARLRRQGLIQRMVWLDYNSFFAEGNNIATEYAATDSTHFLLLNSDIQINDPQWLSHLLSVHKPGITTYGLCDHPLRVDGYCLLVDAEVYREQGGMDEANQFFWANTKFQAKVLAKGYSVQGYAEHERYLHHFGGKSGKDFKSANGLVLPPEELAACFNGRTIRILDIRSDQPLTALPKKNLLRRSVARVQRLFA